MKKAHAALFLASLIYGANYTIAKGVMDDNYIQPLGFILLRVSAGMILFWIYQSFLPSEKIDRQDFGRLILCGLFGIAINQMFFFSGLKLTHPINAALIMTTTPILVLLLSALVATEKITPRKIGGILIGASGAILLITYGQKVSFERQGLLGDFLIFVNAASYGVYLVLVKSLLEKYQPVTVIKWVFVFGWFFVLPFGFEELKEVAWHTFPTSIWIAVAYVLLFTTFLAYLCNAYALKIVNPSVVSIYIYLQPFLATIVALSLKKDTLNDYKIMAAVLIFAGVYLVSSPRLKK